MRNDEIGETRALVASLRNVVDGSPPALQTVVDALPKLLHAEKVAAFGLSLEPSGASLTFAYGSRCLLERGTAKLASVIRERPRDFAAFDTANPAPAQRNVAVMRRDIAAWTAVDALPVAREVFPSYGLSGLDFVRALVCDGSDLLAWVGAFRREPFSERERQVLGQILPALQSRLTIERQLQGAQVATAALVAALEAIGSPAFVVRAPANIVHTNHAGRLLFDRDRGALAEELRAAVGGDESGYVVAGLASVGAPGHFLALRRPPPGNSAPRAAAAAVRWALTPRQRDVLALIASGECNKTIAAKLGCAERTVELHVSACLEKARCEQRAELVAKVWSGA